MPLLTVPAIFDGKDIQLLEDAPVIEPYRVMVTFINPASDKVAYNRFLASFGAWEDERPIDDTLSTIYAARTSKSEPRAF